MASDDVSPCKLRVPRRTKIMEEGIDTVRNPDEEKPNSSISSTAMNLSSCTVWNLWKALRKYPYKPKTVQSLTDQHKLCIVSPRGHGQQQAPIYIPWTTGLWFWSNLPSRASDHCGKIRC